MSFAVWFLAGVALAQSPVFLTVRNSPGYAIPADFSGLSFETRASSGGCFFNPTNIPLITLFRNLGIRNLRIGGATGDGPRAVIPEKSDLDNLFAFARAVGNLTVIYSLRLHDGDRAADANTAAYLWAHYRSRLAGFALGNEPDWRTAQSQDPAITNYRTFLSQWRTFAAAVTNAAPGATLVGPDTGGNLDHGPPDGRNGAWANDGTGWTTQFARDERSSGIVRLITQHHYVASGSPRPTLDALLSSAWDTVTNQTLYDVMGAPVLADGMRYRLTEAEDCVGGVPRVSDTFAGALWALDFMHWWAAHRCAGVDFHNTRWRTNTVITVNNRPDGRLGIYPKGYGLKAFEVGGHGRAEPVTLANADGLNLTSYAVANPANLYVTIINKEHGPGARNARATIRLDGFAAGAVAGMYLTAPHGDVAATSGITLGGASITSDSVWRGRWQALGAVSNNQFTATVPAASAAILKMAIAPGGRH